MPVTDKGACEWFVWDLRRSNLIDRGQLDQLVGEFLRRQPAGEPPALADYLVTQGILSKFQAERLLQGKTQGLVLGPYSLVDSLGSGSMGTVYKAQSKNDSRWYAVKVLPRRSMWNVRIARRHVRTFEQCQHPAVVPFMDVGTSGGMHYLVWPLVEGEPLDRLVEREGKLPPGLAAHYALETAEGLQVCHEHGICHGLLKPSNLMVGVDRQVRILDLGIGALLASAEEESLVDTMSTANTMTSGLDCTSPESILEPSNRTPAGDQYSLGCVLYFCLTGSYPFADGTAVEKMVAHQTKQARPMHELCPDVPEALIEIVDRFMQKSPEARYPRLAEAVQALRPLADASALGTKSLPRHLFAAARAGAGLASTPPPRQNFRSSSLSTTPPPVAPPPSPPAPAREPAFAVAAPAGVSRATAPPRPMPVARIPPRAPARPAPAQSEGVGIIALFTTAALTAAATWLAYMFMHR